MHQNLVKGFDMPLRCSWSGACHYAIAVLHHRHITGGAPCVTAWSAASSMVKPERDAAYAPAPYSYRLNQGPGMLRYQRVLSCLPDLPGTPSPPPFPKPLLPILIFS